MVKPSDPRQLAVDLLPRSTCSVQVAAVLADKKGIFAWGWNSSGPDGLGEHAEMAALRRANRRRLDGATIYVASQRKRNGKTVKSLPCVDCQERIFRYDLEVVYRSADGLWFNGLGEEVK